MRKSVISVFKKDVIQAVGSLQFYAGQVTDVEPAIDSMVDIFKSNDSTTILQSYASNAFSSLKRNVFLYHLFRNL